ncbi:pilin [Patescibacteria group bacterium]|nr:pilin [Patescibacteria group bacterium]MBU1921911.1 pilin [Patescibacteria group bacterium]
MNKNKKIALVFILALVILSLPNLASAFQLIPSGCTGDVVTTDNCGLTEIFQTFINFADFLLSIVGSIALLMFVFGGFTWLTSGGATDKVTKGKDIMVNTAIGLAIVFAAATVIYSVGTALCRGDAGCIQQLNIYSSGTANGGGGIDCSDPENNGKPCGSEKHMVCSSAKKTCVSECAASEDYTSEGFTCMEVSLAENSEEAANKYSQDNPCVLGLCPGDWNNLCCQPHEAVVVDKCCECHLVGGDGFTPRLIPQESTEKCWSTCQAFIRVHKMPETLSQSELDLITTLELEIDPSTNHACQQAIKDWRLR